MMKKQLWVLAGILAIGVVVIPLFAQQPAPAQPGAAQGAVQAPGGGRAGQGPGAQAAGRGGMGGRGAVAVPTTNEESLPKVPVGFTPIFNGKDLTGWHVSKTNHHGTTPDYHVLHGVIVGTQQPFGRGGILLTDKKYKNVEVYMEVKPDWGCDSGLFFWTDEDGGGYQVMLDYLPGGTMVAGVYGEYVLVLRSQLLDHGRHPRDPAVLIVRTEWEQIGMRVSRVEDYQFLGDRRGRDSHNQKDNQTQGTENPLHDGTS